MRRPSLLAILTGLALALASASGAADCAPDAPGACAYGPAPDRVFVTAPEQIVELDYPDSTGTTRRFSIAVRRPLGAPEPLPIVVWSHGGARGQNDASAVGTEWGKVFTGAGYLFVAIAHHERPGMAERLPLCKALGFDATGCETFKFLSWDRPHDVKRVLDWLDQQAAAGESVPGGAESLAGRIDPRRLAYAGHSAGAGATLMLAGASRDFAGTEHSLSDPRPVAFLGCSPQGIGHDGFTESSFEAIDRPYLTLSGSGDATEGHGAPARRDAFDRMAAGSAQLGWIDDATARHGTFNLEPAACARAGGDVAHCAQHLQWLASAALAFTDAHVRGDAEARVFLASDALRIWSGGVFVLSLGESTP